MKFSGKARPAGTRRGGIGALAIVGATMIAGTEAAANDPKIAVGEVAPPPPAAGVDEASLRDAAEGEIRELDASSLPPRRRFVMSLALTGAAAEGPFACTVNAMIRDARTGVMIGIIEAGAQAEGPVSLEARRKIASAAVRNAVRRIPSLVGASASTDKK